MTRIYTTTCHIVVMHASTRNNNIIITIFRAYPLKIEFINIWETPIKIGNLQFIAHYINAKLTLPLKIKSFITNYINVFEI